MIKIKLPSYLILIPRIFSGLKALNLGSRAFRLEKIN
jgi:hypothetical protein